MTTRLLLLVCATALSASMLTSCGNGDDTTDSSGAPTRTTSTRAATDADDSGPTIPAGLYTRHLTPAEARADAGRLGLTDDQAESFVSAVSEDLAFSFKIGDGVWAQYQTVDGGQPELGDSGTFTYDAEGNWATVSNSTGCPGCLLVYQWSVGGDALTVKVVPGHDEDAISTFVTEGTYQRES
jgi:hypothetical protein